MHNISEYNGITVYLVQNRVMAYCILRIIFGIRDVVLVIPTQSKQSIYFSFRVNKLRLNGSKLL